MKPKLSLRHNGILRFWCMVFWAIIAGAYASLAMFGFWPLYEIFTTDLIIAISLAVLAFLLIVGVLLVTGCGYHSDREEPYLYGIEAFPVDLATVGEILLVAVSVDYLWQWTTYVAANSYLFIEDIIVIVAIWIIVAFVSEIYLHIVFSQIRCRAILSKSLIVRSFHGLCYLIRMIPFVWKMMLFWSLIWYSLLWCGVYYYRSKDFFFVLFATVVWGVGFWIILQMHFLKKKVDVLAEGNFSKEAFDERRKYQMLTVFYECYERLASINETMDRAVAEKMQHEKFQTELITNVSHDIKTPLTSIVNYVDLLAREEAKEEPDPVQRRECMEVLTRQSIKLKTLIEDLIEASRASTGQLQCEMMECDLGIFLSQECGEYADRMEAGGLQLNLTIPEEKIYVMADGRFLSRILDNVLNNALKYSVPGTRVYMEMRRNISTDTAVVTIKNISRDELNITSEELKQRFIRGDKSRHSEGHGLGLSIVQSLIELMDGSFEIEIDGDLFKVILKLPVSRVVAASEVKLLEASGGSEETYEIAGDA